MVLVVKDGAAWLRDCLQSLSAQTHARLGAVAVDNGSTDGSRELLEQALGPARVVALGENRGLAGSLKAAVELPAAGAADYLFVLHDDAALAPDAVARLVDAAENIEGVERVGVVGPKVVDWDHPRILREVGRSTDRFGHPYTPLQDGEMDHGQYDRVLEVLFVSSCAMLISRAAWQRTGLPDERLASHHDDLDFCWRARLAGFRVLMTPLAQARHRAASLTGEREEKRHRSSRYYAERAALASMLKNYGILNLLWLLPLYALLGAGRLALLTLSRRFEDAFELIAAWGWNVAHLPGTLRRRVRAQSVRTVPDRAIRRFMESATLRLPRWFETAGRIIAEQRGIEEEPEELRLRARAASLAASHPVLVGWSVAAVLGAVALRSLLGPGVLQGAALPAFPSHASGFFGELLSGVRTTGLGGAQVASPALAAMGAASGVLFASPALAQKVILAGIPLLAVVSLFGSLARQTGQRVPAVLGAAAYGLSATMFWAFSEGRIDTLVALAVLPVVADRLDAAFATEGPPRRRRFAVGFGAATAAGVAFLPGVALAAAVLLAVHLLFSPKRGRGLLLTLASAVAAAALVFPMLPDLVSGRGVGLGAHLGTADFSLLARLAPGSAPGSWPVAWFLPVSALVAFSIVGKELRGRAWRAVFAAVAGLFLAWASAAGYLPAAVSNSPVYVALAAASEAMILGYGLVTLATGIERQAFGYRQVAAAALAVVMTAGFGLQAIEGMRGDWAVGPDRLFEETPAWSLIQGSPGDFRVLWIGGPTGGRFPTPGGDPQGIVSAGGASVRYSITGKAGAGALDVGRAAKGPGYDYTARALEEILAGQTSHAGALLSVLGVRFVVAKAGDVPWAASRRLDAQLDLDLLPAGGLVIYRNARSIPPAMATDAAAFARASHRSDLGSISELPAVPTIALQPVAGGWTGSTGGGFVYLASQFDAGWRAEVDGQPAAVGRAFGWAMGFPTNGSSAMVTKVDISYPRPWIRTVEMVVLGLLWLAALWITRRPVSG